MPKKTLQSIDIPGSILFLGSGFSKPAKNIRNEELPTGSELKHLFAKLLGVDANHYDLKTLADEFASRKELNLYQTLYELFTIKELQPHQEYILAQPWRRIYTTNYDDSVEFSYSKRSSNVASYSYDDEKPSRLQNGSVIHLHGVIRKANEENILNQIVLNESAYVRQHFEKSTWYDDFVRDLRFCSACFFIGYSLADYHISALLMQNPATRDKTYFTTPRTDDKIFANRVEPYGSILSIDTEGFADLCKTLPRTEINSDPHSLHAFKFLDPFKDRKTLHPPTAQEILSLVTYGTFNYQRCLSTLPGTEYVVPRQDSAKEAIAKLSSAKCLLVHSRIGNGKSIFLYILAHKLAERGYNCFWCKPNPLSLQRDTDLLKSFKNVAFFFDSYDTAVETIKNLAEQLPDAKFIVAVRTGVQDVRFHEMQSLLPTRLERVNLNGIKQEDSQNFKRLLNNSGVRTGNLESVIDESNDFREVVLKLYDNEQIREKIKGELEPLLRDQGFLKIFVASHLLKWVGHDVDSAFLRSVTHKDAYAEMIKFREIAGDFFQLDDDNLQVRSAMFSEYFIRNYLTTKDIIDCVYPIVIEAVKRKSERRYRAILSSFMRFSVLYDALSKDPDRLNALISLFEKLRRDIDVNQEPLFWLQYAILMTEADDLDTAEGFIRTAYERASANPGFQTFQLDTYALRLFLRIEEDASHVERIERFEDIVEKIERVCSMIGDVSRRFHAIQVLEGFEPFVRARINSFSGAETNTLVYHLSLLIERLDQILPEDRAQTGSDLIKASLERAKNFLVDTSVT